MARVKQLLEDFATLHEGGAVASVKDKVHPLSKNVTPEDYLKYVAEHLDGDVPIGVYPLWQRNNVWMVNWAAVDLDEGDISDIHADNLVSLLSKMNIQSWKEPSRSKGYHVWVYLKEPISASIARNGMIGACRTVDVPIREVYPKQIHLEANKIGNCLRLPYPKIRSKGKQVVEGYSLKEFVEEAMEGRTSPPVFRKLLSLYTATEPARQKFTNTGNKTNGDFVGVAEEIWQNPSKKRGVEATDRSATLYAFAGSLLWQEYSIAATIDWVRRLDDRLGKYVDRTDRERRIEALVERAAQEVTVRD
tara:strand:- start:1779 stop:2693 length:915 start_codon:yes stop_codon:yes gene_type:complete